MSHILGPLDRGLLAVQENPWLKLNKLQTGLRVRRGRKRARSCPSGGHTLHATGALRWFHDGAALDAGLFHRTFKPSCIGCLLDDGQIQAKRGVSLG